MKGDGMNAAAPVEHSVSRPFEPSRPGSVPLSVGELRGAVEDDTIDTVVLAMPDMQGRLQGKRLDAHHFVEDVLDRGAHACAYLLGTDVEMDIIDGIEIVGWDTGLGDFELIPDLSSMRLLPWMPGTALVLADAVWENGSTVGQAPREILRRQLARLQERGWYPLIATELEFLLFGENYRTAQEKGYRELTPATAYDVDYSILGTAGAEPLMRQIRRGMRGAGMEVESLKGECNEGQFELGFKYDDALKICDNHAIFKTGAKEIATQHDVSISFIAKFNQREGNSCHIHFSLVDEAGDSLFQNGDGGEFSSLFEHFLAGQLAGARELSLFVAPHINSYKRFQDGHFAPTTLRWARDNRTSAVRVLGRGQSLRLENRSPGADVNPYLAVAAVIAAGLEGVDRELELPQEAFGNVYAGSAGDRMPTSLGEALTLWRSSSLAADAFGADVVDHYASAARHELDAFESAVTDWERQRGFERL
jgi:glutamine synthetase